MLEDLLGFVYEYVLQLLGPRDYAQLCLTSRTLLHYTSDFLTHRCDSITSHHDNLAQFFATNYHLLLPYERKLYSAYQQVLKTLPGVDHR